MKKKLTALSLAAIISLSGIPLGYAADTEADYMEITYAAGATETSMIPAEPYYDKSDAKVSPLSKEEESKILEKLILFVKENICDTDYYDSFSYNTYLNEYGKTSFNLNWNNSNDGYAYMYVSIDSDANLENYYAYNDKDYDYYSGNKIKLPAFTKNDALDAAINFVKKVAPQYSDEISENFAQIYVSRYNSDLSYSVTLQRVRNGILIENEAIYLGLNSKGEVTNYSNYGTKNISKDAPTKIAPYTTIVNAFKESNPLELRYIPVYDSATQKSSIRLAYVTPTYDSKIIDAETGKAYTLEYRDMYASGGSAVGGVTAEENAVSYDTAAEKQLSYVEQTAVDNHLNLLNADDVKKILLKHENIVFSDKFELNYSNLSTNKSNYSDKYIYYLSASFSYNDKDGNYASVYATVNAETGEIRSYSYHDSNYPITPYSTEEKASYYASFTKNADAVKVADAFIKELYGDKAGEYKLNDSVWGEQDTYGYLSYTRYVNDIPFDSDYISICFNRTTGKITSIYFEYSDDAVFPSAEKKITLSTATDKLFESFPLNVYYKPYVEKDEENSVMYYTWNSEIEKKLALVYSYNEMTHVFVDALTGKVCNRWSEDEAVYVEKQYFDTKAIESVKDHDAAEQILALYNLGGIEISKDFNPDAEISIDEFEKIVSNIINTGYYNPRITPVAALYSYEKDGVTIADASMTREKAVIVMVNMIGYGEIAQMSELFKNDGELFKNIDASLTGYYAIANALGLLNEISTDTANGKLTYAGACCFVYNYILYTNAEG